NLLNAANNTRLPLNSWTIYQAGLGAADHPTTENGIRIKPVAYFNTFWLGLSPVRESSFSFETRQEFTGAEKIIINAGGEGGKLDNVSFVSAVNDQKTTSGQLESFYVQAYLQFLNRDMNLISTTKLNYTTTYYPHLSYSGNVTGSNFAARYYGGVILSKHMKPYIGADYTHNWKGWAFHGNAIYYYNQNQEYYSHAEGSLSKNFNIWKGYGLTLHSSARYAFERRVQQFLEEPIDNFVDAGVSLNFSHWATLGASYYFGDLLPDSIESAWKYNASLRPWKYIAFSAFFSPYNSQHTYGASMSINSATHPERVALTLGWQHQVYEYGEDAFGEDLKSEHDVFSANINFQF
ncbi:MAG: hypothetical protein KAG10_01750, partial [Methylococcales bacterium]|nr:hypothetical protein [Methylococcales bacterium]